MYIHTSISKLEISRYIPYITTIHSKSVYTTTLSYTGPEVWPSKMGTVRAVPSSSHFLSFTSSTSPQNKKKKKKRIKKKHGTLNSPSLYYSSGTTWQSKCPPSLDMFVTHMPIFPSLYGKRYLSLSPSSTCNSSMPYHSSPDPFGART